MAHGDITHLEIPTGDFEAAKAFYGELFGWQIADVPGFEGYPMWQAPNQISGGGLVAPGGHHAQPVSMVEVDSVDATLAKVTAGGGEVLQEKTPISETSAFAIFRDPDGNVLGLYEGVTEVPDA